MIIFRIQTNVNRLTSNVDIDPILLNTPQHLLIVIFECSIVIIRNIFVISADAVTTNRFFLILKIDKPRCATAFAYCRLCFKHLGSLNFVFSENCYRNKHPDTIVCKDNVWTYSLHLHKFNRQKNYDAHLIEEIFSSFNSNQMMKQNKLQRNGTKSIPKKLN